MEEAAPVNLPFPPCPKRLSLPPNNSHLPLIHIQNMRKKYNRQVCGWEWYALAYTVHHVDTLRNKTN